jgi:general secretion pathway protein G
MRSHTYFANTANTANTCSRRLRRARRAFTLVEIIIVVALLGIIMGVLIPNVGSIFEGAKEDLEKQKVEGTLNSALLQYNTHIGSYPSTEEGLQALIAPPAGKAAKWRGPYLKDNSLIRDSWDGPYKYVRPGTHNPRGYDLWSFGPNGRDENGGGDDVPNWPKTDATTPAN